MKVTIVATKTCRHCPALEQHLKNLGISYDVIYVEENAQLCEEHRIGRSPNIMVDGKVVFQGMPTLFELKKILQLDKSKSD